jgi:hypothetical protein
MSDATLQIGRNERAALHQLLLQRLTGSTDPGLMIQREDFEAAERYANESAADVRLLNDLGWDPEDRREIFAITVPKDELSGTLWRLRVSAEEGMDEPEDVRRGRDEDADLLMQYARARDVCAELIHLLGNRADPA